MTGVKWQDGVSREEVAKRCVLGDIQERLQWFGHVRSDGEEGVLRMVEKKQVQGNRLLGKSKKRLEQLMQGDMKKKGIKEEQAIDRKSWEKLIAGPPITGKEKDCRQK